MSNKQFIGYALAMIGGTTLVLMVAAFLANTPDSSNHDLPASTPTARTSVQDDCVRDVARQAELGRKYYLANARKNPGYEVETTKQVDESQQAVAAWKAFANAVKTDIPRAQAAVLAQPHRPKTFRLSDVRDDVKKSDSLKCAYIGELTLRTFIVVGELPIVGEVYHANERTYRFGWIDGRWKYLENRGETVSSVNKSDVGRTWTGSDPSDMDVWERVLFQSTL